MNSTINTQTDEGNGGTSNGSPRQYQYNSFVDALEELDRESPLTQYFQILLRRRWMVIGGIAAGILIALLASWMTTPLYRATTLVEIAREADEIVDVKGAELGGRPTGNEFYPTQYGLLKSRALAQSTVRKLRLDQNATFLYGYKGSDESATKSGADPVDPRVMQNRATGILVKNISITPIRNSGLVSVSFDSPDPGISQLVANTYVQNFIASNLERRFESSAYARKFLEDKIADTRAKLEESERAVVNYAESQQIINFESQGNQSSGAASTPGQSLAEAELAAVNAALVGARSRRVDAEARNVQARRRGGLALSESLSDNSVLALKNQRTQLSADYSKGLNRFQPDYPSMVAMRQQIAEIDRQLGSQGNVIVGSLSGDYQAALQSEQALQSKVAQLKGEILNLRRRSIQYNIYQRDADTNRVLYDGLLQRYKEIGIAGGVGNNNVAVVDEAAKPGSPYTPQTMLNLVLGLLGGLLVGAILAFLVEQLDESIVAPHDLERKLGIPLLGSIPRVGDGEVPLALLDDPKSAISEAYFSVQTALQFTTNHGAPKTILFTSARASEGKSTCAMALSRNLATRGQRILLIDGDMRNPSVHSLLKLPNKQGFSDLLSGSDDFTSLMQPGPVKTLTIITSGPIPPNPSELLSGQRLHEVLNRLRMSFDHIVIDGPPVLGLADSPIMSAQVEGTIFVIAAIETRAKAARIALRRLFDVNARIAGAILTKFNSKQAGYEYGYSYDYGGGRKSLKRFLGKNN